MRKAAIRNITAAAADIARPARIMRKNLRLKRKRSNDCLQFADNSDSCTGEGEIPEISGVSFCLVLF